MNIRDILCAQEEIISEVLAKPVFTSVDSPEYLDNAQALGFILGASSFESLLDATSKVHELCVGSGFQVALTGSSEEKRQWKCKNMGQCSFEVAVFKRKNGKVHNNVGLKS